LNVADPTLSNKNTQSSTELFKKALKAPKNSFTLSQTMNNQATIGRVQEWREKDTKAGKALPLKDVPFVFFGINVATLSVKEWFTIGVNKTQAKQRFDKFLKDKAKEGKNGGGLNEQVPIMLQVLTDNETDSELVLDGSRQELIDTLRHDVKDGEPITKREKSLIDLGIDISLGINYNWFAVGGVEGNRRLAKEAEARRAAHHRGRWMVLNLEEMYIILSAKKGEEVEEKDEKEEEDDDGSESEEEDSETMNNQKTIRLVQEWREKANAGKALPPDDLLFVFFGTWWMILSAKEWFTIGANKAQAKEFDKLLNDKAKEGKNGGGLIKQVPIMLQILTDDETEWELPPHSTCQDLVETIRIDFQGGEPITKREKSLIDLGIDIASGIIFNWFSVGGVEEYAEAYKHAIVNDVAEEGKNGGGTREKMKDMYRFLSADWEAVEDEEEEEEAEAVEWHKFVDEE
jgi:hypothetical protein